jgi:hypothetical protein
MILAHHAGVEIDEQTLLSFRHAARPLFYYLFIEQITNIVKRFMHCRLAGVAMAGRRI